MVYCEAELEIVVLWWSSLFSVVYDATGSSEWYRPMPPALTWPAFNVLAKYNASLMLQEGTAFISICMLPSIHVT